MTNSSEDRISTPTPTTLKRLCSDLGPELIEIVVAPTGIDVPIDDVLLHDAADPVPSQQRPRLLYLVMGLHSSPEADEHFIRSAARARVAAIAARNVRSWSRNLLASAEDAGIALLEVANGVDWGDLFELARAATTINRTATGDREVVWPGTGLSDLFALAEVIAAVAGGPVTIGDMQSRILAFSAIDGSEEADEARLSTILNRRVPDRWQREMREQRIIEQLLDSDDVLHVPSSLPNKRPRRVIAVRVGTSVLGSIWLAGDDEALSPDADEALRRAAPIAGLLMKRQRIGRDVEQRMLECQLHALLQDGDPAPGVLERLGLPAGEPLLVLAVEATAGHATSPAQVGPRVVDLLSLHLDSYPHSIVATPMETKRSTMNEYVYVLTSCRHPGDRPRLEAMVELCIRHANRALRAEVRAGIGLEVDDLSEVPEARRSAEAALELAPDGAAVTSFEEVHHRSLLTDVERLVVGRTAGPSTGYRALAEYDKSHETDFVTTLRAVLDNFGNAKVVGQEMNLHPNSVRYRVKRIAEITGVELDDPDSRLALELELRARSDY